MSQDRGWALVTGAGRRLGAVLALAAARAGYDIAVHVRREADAAECLAAVQARGRRAIALSGDLALPETAAALASAAPRPWTLLINSASVFEPDSLTALTVEQMDRAWQVNLRAPVLLASAFAAGLPPDREGQVINVIDQRVWRLNPNYFAYTLAKSALWTATQTLAQGLAPRIRVNAIGPGPVLPNVNEGAEGFAAEAAATPLARSVDPEEIGQALNYLLSARSVTGQMIAVDSGQHLAWRTPDVQP